MKNLFTLLLTLLCINMYGQNFVPNSDFEGGDGGWSNSGADSRVIVSPGFDGSTNAYQITALINKGAQYITDGTTEVASGDYELSFRAKGKIGELAKFKVKFKDGSTKTINGTAFKATDSWELFSTTVTLTEPLLIDKFILQSNIDLGTGVLQTFVADDLFFGTRATYNLSKSITGAGTITPSSDDLPQNSSQTITAIPYLGYEFSEWGGDLSGTTNPTPLTMDGDKSISATFVKVTDYSTLFEWNFNTPGDLEGWEAYTNCDIVVENGAAVMTMTGNWPRFRHDKLGVLGDELDVFEIRLKNNTSYDVDSDTPLKFVFVDSEGTQRSNIIDNTTANDADFKTYRVLLGGHDYWNGNIESFLIMGPTKLADPQAAGTVEIDYIKLLKGNADATLSSITCSEGSLDPVFSADVNDYTLNVPVETTLVNFSAVATESDKATVSIRQINIVDGEEVASELVDGNADLSTGSAKVSILVQAENGIKNFYIIEVSADIVDNFDLTTSVVGAGMISPSEGAFPEGSDQIITAEAYLGYEFSEWGGDLSGTTNPTALTMDGAKSISATFVKAANYTTLFEWNFNVDDDSEGWIASQSSAVVSGGSAILTLEGNYPKIVRDQLGIDSDELDVFEIRLKNNTAFGASDNQMKVIFWDGVNQANRNIKIENASVNDTEFKTYRIALGGHENWTGIIESISFMGPALLADPQAAGTVEIDYIKLLKGNADATLSSITCSEGSLDPVFSADVNDYTLNVPVETTLVNFSAVATESDKSTVSIRQINIVDGEEVASELVDGNADLSTGSAKVSIMVQAENGIKNFYIIKVTADIVTNISEDVTGFLIYPNPVESTLNIETSGELGRITIYSLSGQKVYEANLTNSSINISHLPNSVYIASVEVNGKKTIKKFIKK